MAHIFDHNSEFKKYLKKQEGKLPEVEELNLSSSLPVAESATELHIDEHLNRHTILAEKKASAYTLDLSSKSLKAPTANHRPSPKQVEPHLVPTRNTPQPIASNTVNKKAKREYSQTTEFILEHVRTFLYGVIIFLIGYLVLNYSAYYEVGKNVYYEATNQEQNPVLRTFTDNQTVDEVLSIESDASDEIISSIPPFDIEITPPGTRIIIPRLNKNVPVVSVSEDNLIKRNWEALEKELQSALRDGVVHYPGTPWPGQSGNVVLTGHSSYYPWDPGRFKDVFAILHNVNIGDEIVVFHNQRKYRYKVNTTQVVLPEQVEVLGDTGDNRLTLLTCTPIGTNLKRLIVTAVPIDEQ